MPRCPILPFVLLFAPSRDHPLGEQQAANVTAFQALMHGTIGEYQGSPTKAWPDEISWKANPGRPPEMDNFPNFGILTPRGDPVAPRCHEVWVNQVAEVL